MSQLNTEEWKVHMVTAPEFLRRMRLFEPGQIYKDWKYSALWVLDDIDKAGWKLDDLHSLWEVLNTRVGFYWTQKYHKESDEYKNIPRMRKTVITGNVMPGSTVSLPGTASGDTVRAHSTAKQCGSTSTVKRSPR